LPRRQTKRRHGGRRQATETAWKESAGGGRLEGDSLLPL
jgi:hypothetical protein